MNDYITVREISKRFGIHESKATRTAKKVTKKLNDNGVAIYCAAEIEAILREESETPAEVPEGCLILMQLCEEFHTSRESIRKAQKEGIFPPARGVALLGSNKSKTQFYSREEVKQFYRINGKPKKGVNKGMKLRKKDRVLLVEQQENKPFSQPMVRLANSGKIVPRRIVYAPDRIGYYE